jgi:LacI family transcriptional regulator
MKNLPGKIAHSIIQDVITANDLQPGDRLPTVRDIQTLFEVSTSTIKKAFELLADQGLIDIHHGSGCFLKKKPAVPRQKKKALSITAALPHYARYSTISTIESGLIASAKRHGIKLQILGFNSYTQERDQVTDLLADGTMSGLIVYPMPRTVKQLRTDYLHQTGSLIPLILIDMGVQAHKHPQIRFDNYETGYEITRRLLAEGRQRIVFKRLKSKHREILYRSNDDRFQGYCRALAEAGLPCQPSLCWQEEFSSQPDSPLGRSAIDFIEQWKSLPAARRPDAVLSLEDMHAAALIREAKHNGIRVPDDLKVVGFDNLPEAVELAGQIFPTTLPDFALMGTMAVSALLRRIYEPPAPAETYILPVPLKWI